MDALLEKILFYLPNRYSTRDWVPIYFAVIQLVVILILKTNTYIINNSWKTSVLRCIWAEFLSIQDFTNYLMFLKRYVFPGKISEITKAVLYYPYYMITWTTWWGTSKFCCCYLTRFFPKYTWQSCFDKLMGDKIWRNINKPSAKTRFLNTPSRLVSSLTDPEIKLGHCTFF